MRRDKCAVWQPNRAAQSVPQGHGTVLAPAHDARGGAAYDESAADRGRAGEGSEEDNEGRKKGSVPAMTRYLVLSTTLAGALFFTPLMMRVVEGETLSMAPGDEKEICAGVKASVTPDPAKFGELRTKGDPKGDAAV